MAWYLKDVHAYAGERKRAGGLAGLFYGYEQVPEDWLSVIKKRDWIEGLCETKMD